MKNIWVVCSYFNFCKTPTKLKNFNIFRDNVKRYGLNLLCVEFDPSANFEINGTDVDVLLQLSDGDIMWQKERLINIGIDLLPTNTDIVLVCDADLIFTDDKFIEKLQNALDRYSAVQCFSVISHLKPDKNVENFDYFNVDFDSDDVFFGRTASCVMAYNLYGNFPVGAAGYIWGFRYENIKKTKLFESNIIGSGDRVSASAFIGLAAVPWAMSGGEDALYEEYLNKAKNNGINRDTVGYLDVEVYDLYHGNHSDRKYMERHQILKDVGFNAKKDLISKPGAAFGFAPHISERFKSKIKNYFYSRNEM